ncbi:hypothetical protein [Branchiibius cervicis]|uniref:UmuC domain-containing protein n=1 Tax=Branchiibius cervicis TaxID=908252 RepID=A0ABW2AXC6_9MICO
MFVSNGGSWQTQGSILHADLDAFFASVEQRDDPSLRGRPVIVGGGIAMAASYEAKACGVRAAMPERVWRPLCPDAIVVPARLSAYSQASKDVFAVLRDITPVVEPLSIDEAFLDVDGLRRSYRCPQEVAVRVREQVRSSVGLPISVGVARTKFLAKIASAHCKPDGLLVVPADEAGFLHPLPIERLWGVGKVTAEKLRSRGCARSVNWPRSTNERSPRPSVRPPVGTCTPSPTCAIRGRFTPAIAGDRSAHRVPSERDRAARARSTTSSPAWSTVSPTGCVTVGCEHAP